MQYIASLSKRYAPSILRHIQPLINCYTPLNHNSNFPNLTDFTPQSFSQTLSTYNTDWQRAFEFFDWVETTQNFTNTTTTYNQMIDVLGESFVFDLVWKLIDRESPPDHSTFRTLFKRYAAAHMVKEAIHCYNEQLSKFNLKDMISFLNLIESLCDYNHVVEAEELCQEQFPGNTRLYNVILRGWFKMGWWSKFEECWEKMEEKGLEPDLHSYLIHMDVLRESGKPWKMVTLYYEMKKKGIKLDVDTHNTVIRVVAHSEGVDMAMKIYEEMIKMGCKPNDVTYNTLIKLLCKIGRLRNAYSMFCIMTEKGCFPDIMTYHCLLSRSDEPKKMLKMFDRMIGNGVRPAMDTYVMLLTKFGRWGLLGPIFRVWNSMEHEYGPDAFAYNTLIDALIHKGLLDMARKYDKEMLALGLSAKPRKELGTEPPVY